MTPLLVGVTILIISLTVIAWAWAVRRPVPVEQAAPEATPTEERSLTYAAIGASDVVGMGASDPETQSWVSVLHAYMPEGTRFVRLGRGGITLREANQVEVPEAVEAQPDIITLWNSVNDAVQGVPLPAYREELEKALTKLTEETSARIVVLNLPDITVLMDGVPEGQRAPVRGGIVQWNKAIDEIAGNYSDRVTVVDLYPASEEVLDHPEYISPDNFHPSTVGYQRLAELVWETIQRERLIDES